MLSKVRRVVLVRLAALNAIALKHFSAVPDMIPNAGIFVPAWSNIWGDTEEQGYKTTKVNVNHVIKMTKLADEGASRC
jgi:hypothetical protein